VTDVAVAAPRVEPGDRRDVGALTWGLARVSGLVTGTTPPNLFLVLGRHRKLFRGWLRFAGRLMPGGTLPRRETELVILRVAHLRGCAYELEHHRRLAARARVSTAEIDRVLDGPESAGWSRREQALLAAVDELHHTGDLRDATWATLREHLDERAAIELVLLASHYEMLATTITTLRIPPDEPRRRRG
jgi:AhpD family alkylhydroperoxidase